MITTLVEAVHVYKVAIIIKSK